MFKSYWGESKIIYFTLAPVITIFPDTKIRSTIFGCFILYISPGNSSGSYWRERDANHQIRHYYLHLTTTILEVISHHLHLRKHCESMQDLQAWWGIWHHKTLQCSVSWNPANSNFVTMKTKRIATRNVRDRYLNTLNFAGKPSFWTIRAYWTIKKVFFIF